MLFFSGIVAGYLAWTSVFFSGNGAAGRLSLVEGAEDESKGSCEGGATKAKNDTKKRVRSHARGCTHALV